MGLFTKLRSKSKSKSAQTGDESTLAPTADSTIPAATTTMVQNDPADQNVSSSPADDKRRGSDVKDDKNAGKQTPKSKDKKDNGVNVRRNIFATILLSCMSAGWSV